MLGYLAVLHAKHIEPKRLMVLTVTAGPCLAHVNDDHVVLADHIQQFALVIGRQSLGEACAKRIHETFQAGRHLRIVLNVVRPQKPRRRLDIAARSVPSCKTIW
jgi:hypothetical protein